MCWELDRLMGIFLERKRERLVLAVSNSKMWMEHLSLGIRAKF